MKKTILFDLDDTLLIDIPILIETLIAVSRHAEEKFDIDPEKLQEAIRQHARQLWHQMPTYEYCLNIGHSSGEGLWGKYTQAPDDAGHVGEDENIQELRSLIKDYRLNAWHNALLDFDIDDKEFATKLSEIFFKERRKNHRLFSNTLEVLNNLKQNYKLGMLTNGISDIQWEKIKGSGLEPYFKHIIISGEHGVGKPNKKIFEIALDKFKAKKEDAVMVGNSLSRDILGAKNAGVKSVWIKREDDEQEKEIKADAVITNLSELPEILTKL